MNIFSYQVSGPTLQPGQPRRDAQRSVSDELQKKRVGLTAQGRAIVTATVATAAGLVIRGEKMTVARLGRKLYNWTSIIEPKTREQAERTAATPFIHARLALMPDCHLGAGATVGSVIPSLAAIIPAAGGVDIGCSMMAVRAQFAAAAMDQPRGGLRRLREAIEDVIPLSAGNYNSEVHSGHHSRDPDTDERCDRVDQPAAADFLG